MFMRALEANLLTYLTLCVISVIIYKHDFSFCLTLIFLVFSNFVAPHSQLPTKNRKLN